MARPPPKGVLKEYCDFIDDTLKRVEELQERVNQTCKEIGCDSDKEKERFMECNVGCPLFYAWGVLDSLKENIEKVEPTKTTKKE